MIVRDPGTQVAELKTGELIASYNSDLWKESRLRENNRIARRKPDQILELVLSCNAFLVSVAESLLTLVAMKMSAEDWHLGKDCADWQITRDLWSVAVQCRKQANKMWRSIYVKWLTPPERA